MVGGSSEEQKSSRSLGRTPAKHKNGPSWFPGKQAPQEASLTKQVELQGNKMALYKKLKQGEATKDKFRSTAQT